jgi:hypothetical protein
MTSDRRTNSARQGRKKDEENPFLNIPWGKEQDVAFDAWMMEQPTHPIGTFINVLLEEGIAIKVGAQGGSVYVTLDSKPAKETGGKHLLSGWANDWREALSIAYWKWDQCVGRDFSHPTEATAKSARR